MPKKIAAKDKPQKSAGNSTGAMSADQSVVLKQLAIEAYELDAFSSQLTHAEAERRIVTLRAKLKLQGEPPHVA
jgi:hypothetical protein